MAARGEASDDEAHQQDQNIPTSDPVWLSVITCSAQPGTLFFVLRS